MTTLALSAGVHVQVQVAHRWLTRLVDLRSSDLRHGAHLSMQGHGSSKDFVNH